MKYLCIYILHNVKYTSLYHNENLEGHCPAWDSQHPVDGSWKPHIDFCLHLCHTGSPIQRTSPLSLPDGGIMLESLASLGSKGQFPLWGPPVAGLFCSAHFAQPPSDSSPTSRVVAEWPESTSWHWGQIWPADRFCLVYTVFLNGFQLLAFNDKSVDFTKWSKFGTVLELWYSPARRTTWQDSTEAQMTGRVLSAPASRPLPLASLISRTCLDSWRLPLSLLSYKMNEWRWIADKRIGVFPFP